MATERAVQYAWLMEQLRVEEGRRSRYPWTSAEINQLKVKGKVTGYTYKLIKPSKLYPELADSSANIHFVKL